MRAIVKLRRTALALLACWLIPCVGRACDPASYEGALRAEREHRLGVAIQIRTSLLACASGDEARVNELALAHDHAAVGDFARAAELIEQAWRRDPIATPPVEVERAVEYRIALGDLTRAQEDARWLLDSSESDAPLAVGAALEADGQWTHAIQWYDALARRHPQPEHWALQAGALVGLGRAYAALGDTPSAARSWEAVNARWPVARAALGAVDLCPPEPPPAPVRRPRRRRGGGGPGAVSSAGTVYGGPGVRSPFVGIDPCGGNRLNDEAYRRGPVRYFAEARFRLARLAAEPCFDPMVIGPTPDNRRDFDLWVEVTLTPMFSRRHGCLIDSERRLRQVVNLGVPQWELAALALLAHIYLSFSQSLSRVPLPPDISRDPSLLDAYRSHI